MSNTFPEQEPTVYEACQEIVRLKKVLEECLITLRHARVFISSREKMYQDGIDLYDQAMHKAQAALQTEGGA
jgi:hypothetical protein